MISQKPVKDERTVAVEKASYSFAFKVLGFAILADVVYRSLVLREATWDLIGIVILGGIVATVYQRWHKAIACNWWTTAAISAGVAFAAAAIIVLLLLLK